MYEINTKCRTNVNFPAVTETKLHQDIQWESIVRNKDEFCDDDGNFLLNFSGSNKFHDLSTVIYRVTSSIYDVYSQLALTASSACQLDNKYHSQIR